MASKYAIINTGSKQHWVEEKSVIEVEKLDVKGEKEVALKQVLLVNDGNKVTVGTPFVAGASVVCEVLGDIKQPKVINFKFKRRKGYKRKKGHRQIATKLKVKSISV